LHRAMIEGQIAELKARMALGGIREATIRAMLYLAGSEVAADERMFAVLGQIRAEQGYDISLSELKALIREQFFMLLIDEDAAVAAIADLAQHEPARIPEVIGLLNRVATATGDLAGDQAIRLARVERLLADASTQLISSSSKSLAGPAGLRREGQRKGGGRGEQSNVAPAQRAKIG
jgi:hypothetical protein